MRKVSLYLVLCVTAALATMGALAQLTGMTPAPKFIQIYREEVKPGKGGAHAKSEARYVSLFKKVNWPSHYTAMTTVAGPNEAWFVTPYDSFAAWAKDMKASENPTLSAEMDPIDASDGDLLSRSSSIFARYREDLSFRPGVNIAQMHNFTITIVRVRPGHASDFEEARKIVKAAHEKAGLKDNHSVWQVISGYPAGTFLISTPYRDLADADANPQIHGKEYQDAIGEDGQKKLRELASSGTLSSETLFFEVDPKMSYPSKETIAADPGFWAAKPAMAKAAPAAKKPAADKSPAKP